MRVCILCPAGGIDAFPALPASDGLRVVGWVATIDDYIVRTQALQPDIVVVDLRSEPQRTEEIVAALTAAVPRARLLVVGARGAMDAARTALARGVAGYVTRDGSRAGLMFALNALAQGGAYITSTGRRAIRPEDLAQDGDEPAGAAS